jgi:hypothetical protein
MNTTLNFVFIIVTAATSLFASSQAVATHGAFAATAVNPPTIIVNPCPLGTIPETTTTGTACLQIPGDDYGYRTILSNRNT